MYKEILRGIDGVGLYPTISIIIFFIFFSAMLYYTFKADKSFIKRMSNLPLETDKK